MLNVTGWVLMALCALVLLVSQGAVRRCGMQVSARAHRALCVGLFALGCALRLWNLGGLPAGLSAEEALVGVQARALFETGGFLFSGKVAPMIAQWAMEPAGTLLMALTAPFVGLFGLSAWAVRLPLALLACAAMPAAYGLGRALGGKRAGRWCLMIYALCPYFVLGARLTVAANAALFLLPIALFAMVRGFEKPGMLYAGAALMALMAYAQDMFLFIAPAAVVVYAAVALAYGSPKRHVLGALALSLLLSAPAVLTLYVNLTGGAGMTLFGWVEIPAIAGFDKAVCQVDFAAENLPLALIVRLWTVLIGGVFQVVMHENIDPALYLPDGMLALFAMSVPLVLLGALSLAARRLDGERPAGRTRAPRTLMIALGVLTVAAVMLYGSEGVSNVNGSTSLYDHAALFLFTALLMAAGLCRVERSSRAGTLALCLLLAASTAQLGVHLFGDGYQAQAGVYFTDFVQAAQRAEEIRSETGAKLHVTDNVYPHRSPAEAAEMMYLFATDADTAQVQARRGSAYDVIYVPGVEWPNADEIYLVHEDDVGMWDFDLFDYEEYGAYLVLSPMQE